MKRPLAERFLEKVDQRGPDDCWPWTGATTPKGYGRIFTERVNGRNVQRYAHHVALELVGCLTERPTRKIHVRHSCDNPPCCNPAHLILGTAKQNVEDREERGRHPHEGQHGMQNGNAKLTEDQVREIKAALAAGESQASITARFPVNRASISNIAIGKRWAHVALMTE